MASGQIQEKDKELDIGPFKYFVEVFAELGSCRVNSMTLGPIPFTAIIEYFKIYDVGTSFEEFHYLIRVMDDTLLALENKKLKNNEKKPSGSKSKGKSLNASTKTR